MLWTQFIKKSGHRLENDAGSQLEDADAAMSSTTVEMIYSVVHDIKLI